MALTRRIRIKMASWMIIVVIASFVGAVYSEFVYPADSPNPGDWRVGLVTGLVIALFSIPLEIFSRDLPLMIAIRNLRIGLNWLVRSAIHFSIILTALLGTQYVFDVFYYHRVMFSTISVAETTQDAIFCVIVLVTVVFVMEMQALLGGRVIANTLLGNYAAPALKQRIFLIVDMVKSSEAATVLGDRRFHGFLSETFKLVESSVEEAEGEIYTFIGDALIASWPLADKTRNGRALAATANMLNGLDAAAAKFEKRYGIRPRIRTVLHGGPVILGQYGEVRRQVTYLGEVLNVASRMERFAKQTDFEIIISQDLLLNMPPVAGLVPSPLPAALLDDWRGKVNLIVLHRLAAASQMPSLAAKKPDTELRKKVTQ